MEHIDASVVVDLNVLVSGIISRQGAAATILQGIRDERILIVLSDEMLDKLLEVLTRPKIRRLVSEQLIDDTIAMLDEVARKVVPDPSVRGIAPDAEDDIILATAIAGDAQAIVTGDGPFLALGEYRGVQLIPTPVFAAWLDALA